MKKKTLKYLSIVIIFALIFLNSVSLVMILKKLDKINKDIEQIEDRISSSSIKFDTIVSQLRVLRNNLKGTSNGLKPKSVDTQIIKGTLNKDKRDRIRSISELGNINSKN